MKRFFAALICVCLCLSAVAGLAESRALSYRFAYAEEAAALKLSNREYLESFNQDDLNYRMQKLGATLEEYEAFAATQMLDWTPEE